MDLDYNFLNTKYIFILFFISVCVLSSIISDNILHSLKSSFFSIRFILYSYIIFILLKKQFNIKNFLNFNLFFLFFCLIDAYIQFIFNQNIFLYKSDMVTGFFFEEKKLGRFLTTLSPILIGLYLSTSRKNINSKLINSLSTLIIIFFITLFTAERVSMFYACFTLVILILFSIKFSKKYLLFIIIPIILIFSSYKLQINNFDQAVRNSVNQITDYKKSFTYPSKQHRSFIITSYKLFTDKPILGVGPNNYRYKCSEIIIKNSNNCSTHPHNIFFQLLAETGLLGILIYIYFLIYIMSRIINFITFKTNRNINIFFILPVFYFCNPFFPSGNFFNNWFMAVGSFGIPFYLYFNDIKIKKD